MPISEVKHSLPAPAEMETRSPGQVHLPAAIGSPGDGCWGPALSAIASGSPLPVLEGKADRQQTNLNHLSRVCTIKVQKGGCYLGGSAETSQTHVLCSDEEGLPRWVGAGGELSILGSGNLRAEGHGGVQEPGMLGTTRVNRKDQQDEWGPEGSQAFIL